MGVSKKTLHVLAKASRKERSPGENPLAKAKQSGPTREKKLWGPSAKKGPHGRSRRLPKGKELYIKSLRGRGRG